MSENHEPWDAANEYEWHDRVATGTLPPLVITIAPTGGAHGKEANPNHPESAEEIAQATYEAYKAGASSVHLHARVPDNLAIPSGQTDDYLKLNALVREKCPDIIIGNTTGGGSRVTAEQRLASIGANPEVCSLNMGPMTGKMVLKKRLPPLSGRPEDIVSDDQVMPMSYRENEKYARAMLEKGIKPEMEVYHPGQWWLVKNLINIQLVKPPYLVQFVMGMRAGMHATPKSLITMLDSAPIPADFSVCAVGPWQLPMINMGIILGLGVRVGMEDNVYYRKGELCASNAQHVERAVKLATELGREIATPKQARQMLGLSELPSQY